MESAFAWLGRLVEWVGQFFPRWIVLDTTQGAVKFVRGFKVVPLKPGIHWYWPATTTIAQYPTARQADDLRTQTFVTTDDKVIAVGGMVIYEVTDIEPLLAHTYKPAQTVTDIALTAIHDVCCKLSWDEIKKEQRKGTLDTKLRRETQKQLEPYGVRVLKTMLTDLSPTKVYKLIQSTSNDS